MENKFEREQPLTKVVGGKPEQAREFFEENKENFEYQEMLHFEREKTPEETAVIESILGFMPEFIKEYGGQPIKGMEPKHVHFIDLEKMGEDEKAKLKKNNKITKGRYRGDLCEIEVFSEGVTIWDAQNSIHELLHMNSFFSATIGKDEKKLRRLGFAIKAKNDTQEYFNQINEAVIEELTNRFGQKYFGLIEELKLIYQLREKDREKLRKKGKIDEADNRFLGMKTKRLESGKYETTILQYPHSRTDERQKLKKLINEIYLKNKNDFSSEEDVFNIFARVIFTGKLSKVAKLVEKTYGKGSFRKLGEDTATTFEAEKIKRAIG